MEFKKYDTRSGEIRGLNTEKQKPDLPQNAIQSGKNPANLRSRMSCLKVSAFLKSFWHGNCPSLNMVKNLILIFISVFFCLSAVPAAFGQTLSDPETGELFWADPAVREIAVSEDNFGLAEDPGIIHPGYHPTELVAKTSFPERYDAREYGYITPIKNQTPYDLCWAESVMSMAESNLIKKGLADQSIDLSEVFPHYFQWHRTPDPLGLTSGDKNIWHAYESYPGYTREWINSWSSGYRAVLLLSAGNGIVPESTAPYPAADADIPNYSLDPSLAWTSEAATLKNAWWISMNDTEAIKRMIMKYGSVVIAFNQNRAKYLNEETGAYYCPDLLYTNHLVNVIGWDNDYDPSAFLTRPEERGAWLVKNSFGTDWGNDGYFWLSYADKTLSEDAFVFDFEPVDPKLSNYQYDGTVSYSYLNDPNGKSIAAGNVFTAQNNETITAVGFTTPSSYFDYEISIYRGVKTDPESGVIYARQSGSELYAGYHTVELENPVKLVGGDRFAVVVEIRSEKNGEAYILTDRSVSYTVTPTNGELFVFQELISDSHPGESWYRTAGGSWTDCWNEDPEKSLGNVRIKAFNKFHSYSVWKNADSQDLTSETNPEKGLSLFRMGEDSFRVPGFN